MTVRGVRTRPEYIPANTDAGWQIDAWVEGGILHLVGGCSVVSDSSHISPRYERYLVAPRVYGNGHIPTLAEMVAVACGWCPEDIALCRYDRSARQWLRDNVEKVMRNYGDGD